MASSGKPRRRRPAGLRRNLQGPLQRADHPGLPRFNGGLVGYFGYDCVRYVEKRLGKCPNPDPLGVPDILLMVSDAVVVFDNLAGKMHAIVLADPARSRPSSRARHAFKACWKTAPADHPAPRPGPQRPAGGRAGVPLQLHPG
jgi:anthranilate/para-aminobenzoate synthase component I